MELLKVDSVEEAFNKLLACLPDQLPATETVPFGKAAGRILAADVLSSEDIPNFTRSTVDGYAVVSKDTAAAGESIPVLLQLAGQVDMGEDTALSISSGQCAEVPTGGMLPAGANAVVMLEYSELFGDAGVAVYSGVAHGENVVLAGEDAKKGAVLLKRGTVLLPQHIGVLAAAGVTQANVFAPLKTVIISTGDELRTPEQKLFPGEVHDINTHTLSALAGRRGFEVIRTLLIPDNEEKLEQAVKSAMPDCDLVLVSGGSSQGKKDATRKVLDSVSSPGVFTHGLAAKPGKPTILGYDAKSRTLMCGLPGHPVAAMMVFELLFSRLYRQKTGSAAPPAIPARLGVNVASSPGKLTSFPVRLEKRDGAHSAFPVFGKSGLITTLAAADGYFSVDRNREGLNIDEIVDVHLF